MILSKCKIFLPKQILKLHQTSYNVRYMLVNIVIAILNEHFINWLCLQNCQLYTSRYIAAYNKPFFFFF